MYMHNDGNYAMYKRSQTCKTHKERLQTWTHYTFTVSHMQSALSLSHTSTHQANKHTDEALQAQNPFITSRCGEDAEVAHQVVPSLYINP